MTGERTLFRKIQVVLDYVRESKRLGAKNLASFIAKRQPTNFIYYWRDRETDTIKHRYSDGSIAFSAGLAGELGLMSPKDLSSDQEVRLTKIGVSACDPVRYPAILGRQVTEYLVGFGITTDLLGEAITGLLAGPSPKPPTADLIWMNLPAQVRSTMKDELKFRQLLNLLGQCKVVLMSQRRIYLPRPRGL